MMEETKKRSKDFGASGAVKARYYAHSVICTAGWLEADRESLRQMIRCWRLQLVTLMTHGSSRSRSF